MFVSLIPSLCLRKLIADTVELKWPVFKPTFLLIRSTDATFFVVTHMSANRALRFRICRRYHGMAAINHSLASPPTHPFFTQ